MKKLQIILIMAGMAIFSNFAYSQNSKPRDCGTQEHLAWMIQQDPNLETKMKAEEAKIQAYITTHEQELTSAKTVVTIPVVIHIVYSTTAQNLADSRVTEQLNVLNTDYAGLNIHSMFGFSPSLKANCEIQFCLAQRKADGTATTGIERRQTTVSSFSTNDAVKHYSSGGLDAWDPTKYLNIWVCNLSGGVLGYAQFPTSGINSTYGVVIMYNAFGVTGAAAPFNLGGTASHEVGHCLNLYHIWGDDGTACTGTDNCGDTPNQAGYNSGMPAYPHVTCSNSPTGDMFMNFMDYTDDAGYSNFTPGQKVRMQALVVSGGALYSLINSNGCQPPATGGCNPASGLNATAIATTTATLNWVAVTAALSYNLQYRIVGATSWTSAGNLTTTSKNLTGLVAASNYEFQVQTVCSSGTASFSGSGTFSTTSAGCIDVYESNESLTAAKLIAVNSNIIAKIGTATDVDWFQFANTTSQKKIKITLTNLPADYDVILYKSNGNQVGISQAAGTTNESIVYNSGAVGTYYVKIFGYNGVFNSASCYTLNAAIGATNFRGTDDNFEEASTTMDLSVYPNPATNQLNLDFNTSLSEKTMIRMMDVTGRVVRTDTYDSTKGMNQYSIDLSGLGNGIYFVELTSGSQRYSRKVTISK